MHALCAAAHATFRPRFRAERTCAQGRGDGDRGRAVHALDERDIGGAGSGGGNGGVAAALAAIGEHELMEAPAPTTPVVIASHTKGMQLRARVLCRHAVLPAPVGNRFTAVSTRQQGQPCRRRRCSPNRTFGWRYRPCHTPAPAAHASGTTPLPSSS